MFLPVAQLYWRWLSGGRRLSMMVLPGLRDPRVHPFESFLLPSLVIWDDPLKRGCVAAFSEPFNRLYLEGLTNDSLVMLLYTFFFFFFLERAWLVGSAGPAGGTIVRPGWGCTGSSRCELQYNKRWKAWGQNALENAGQHHYSLVNGKKAARNNFSSNNEAVVHPPRPPGGSITKAVRSVNWALPIKIILIHIGLKWTELRGFNVFKFLLQEVHELLGNYDLKYCFVDKYKGTGWSDYGLFIIVSVKSGWKIQLVFQNEAVLACFMKNIFELFTK